MSSFFLYTCTPPLLQLLTSSEENLNWGSFSCQDCVEGTKFPAPSSLANHLKKKKKGSSFTQEAGPPLITAWLVLRVGGSRRSNDFQTNVVANWVCSCKHYHRGLIVTSPRQRWNVVLFSLEADGAVMPAQACLETYAVQRCAHTCLHPNSIFSACSLCPKEELNQSNSLPFICATLNILFHVKKKKVLNSNDRKCNLIYL